MPPPKTIPLHPAPLYLEEGAVSSPVVILHEFFLDYDLLTARELLWKWFRHTVTGSLATAGNEEERKALVDFYENMQKLVEAAHIISVYDRRYHINHLHNKK